MIETENFGMCKNFEVCGCKCPQYILDCKNGICINCDILKLKSVNCVNCTQKCWWCLKQNNVVYQLNNMSHLFSCVDCLKKYFDKLPKFPYDYEIEIEYYENPEKFANDKLINEYNQKYLKCK